MNSSLCGGSLRQFLQSMINSIITVLPFLSSNNLCIQNNALEMLQYHTPARFLKGKCSDNAGKALTES